ncbi:hypothetical protein YC2023_004517 [Brassica napus]
MEPRGARSLMEAHSLNGGTWPREHYQAALLIVLRCTCARCERICCLWGFAGVGRMFYEEARNTCIKGDTSAHTQRFLRLSGSTKRVEECMGQDPGILRGRILARLRTMGMSRFSKSRRPKLRILMLDSTGLACASRASKGCNGLSGRSLCRFPSCV